MHRKVGILKTQNGLLVNELGIHQHQNYNPIIIHHSILFGLIII